MRAERSDGIRSRETILNAAAKLATVEGLNGLSIGRLAEHIGMSKSGLYAHFGSKEELQLATIETAKVIFADTVVLPVIAIADPLERLIALCDSFLGHLERRVFPGGCFFASVAAEFDTQQGAVRDSIDQVLAEWMGLFMELLHDVQAQGRLTLDEELDQLAFELDAYLLMANMQFVMSGDVSSLRRAAKAVRSRLALATAESRPIPVPAPTPA